MARIAPNASLYEYAVNEIERNFLKRRYAFAEHILKNNLVCCVNETVIKHWMSEYDIGLA